MTSLVSRLSTTTSKNSLKLQLKKLIILGGAITQLKQNAGLSLLSSKAEDVLQACLFCTGCQGGITLQSDGDKLNRWAEHFKKVMNCQVDIDVVPCEDLPVVSPSFVSSDTLTSDEDIFAPLSEEEIVTAISELRSGKAPGMDGISLGMLSLGGGETICWLKSIFDTIWETDGNY